MTETLLVALDTLVLVSSLVVWVEYLRRIPAEQVPADARAHRLVMSVHVLIALFLLLWLPIVPTPIGATLLVLSTATAAIAGFFVWLLTQAPLPDGTPTFAVGQLLPDFEAVDHTGAARHIHAWRGQPLLLKFFRGHW